MKRARLFAIFSLILGLSTVASASKINTASSNYGTVSNAEACYSLGTLSGVSVSPEAFLFSVGSDCVFDLEINSGSDFTLTFTAPEPFLTEKTFLGDTYFGNGFFVCPGAGNQCGPDPTASGSPYDVSVTADSQSISLTVNGSGDGLVFFVVEPETPGSVNNIVEANITPNSSAVPEPRLIPLIGLALIGFLLLRVKSTRLS